MTPYKIKIITPEKTFYEGETEQITVRTSAGNVGILAGHTPYVANIMLSPLRIKIDGEFRTAAISGGLLTVSKSEVTIVTNAIEWAEEIDVLRAQRAKEKADKMLKQQLSQKEFDKAERNLKRALNRLVVAGKK